MASSLPARHLQACATPPRAAPLKPTLFTGAAPRAADGLSGSRYLVACGASNRWRVGLLGESPNQARGGAPHLSRLADQEAPEAAPAPPARAPYAPQAPAAAYSSAYAPRTIYPARTASVGGGVAVLEAPPRAPAPASPYGYQPAYPPSHSNGSSNGHYSWRPEYADDHHDDQAGHGEEGHSLAGAGPDSYGSAGAGPGSGDPLSRVTSSLGLQRQGHGHGQQYQEEEEEDVRRPLGPQEEEGQEGSSLDEEGGSGARAEADEAAPEGGTGLFNDSFRQPPPRSPQILKEALERKRAQEEAELARRLGPAPSAHSAAPELPDVRPRFDLGGPLASDTEDPSSEGADDAPAVDGPALFTNAFKEALQSAVQRSVIVTATTDDDEPGHAMPPPARAAAPAYAAPPPEAPNVNASTEMLSAAIAHSRHTLARLTQQKALIENMIEKESKQLERIAFVLERGRQDSAYYRTVQAMLDDREREVRARQASQ